MKKLNVKMRQLFLLLIALVFGLSGLKNGYSQDNRWLRIGELHTFINELGAEREGESSVGNTDFFNWPSLYGNVQQTVRSKALWMGCTDFDDPVEGAEKTVKVISVGPRIATEEENMIFEQELKLLGKYESPAVVVDNAFASVNQIYDILDDLPDPDLECDRMVMVKFNTSMGISVTKKVLAFGHPDHDNYFIYDFVFKNTGIYNEEGDVTDPVQRLENVWFYYLFRYAFAGESRQTYNEQLWGTWESTWGENTLNHAFGQDPDASSFTDPTSDIYQMRGFYSYAGPDNKRTNTSLQEDWGCANELDDGVMASAKYTGCVTLFASREDNVNEIHFDEDDVYQPATTWFLSSDINIVQTNVSQYNEVYMSDRWDAVTEGHPDQQHDEVVGENRYPNDYIDNRRNTGGGTSQAQGFGPYTMDPGDSVHIVFAEGAAGISRQKNREVGANWLQYFNSTGAPTLTMPDGSAASDQNDWGYEAHNAYKRAWIATGRDSILQTYRNAMTMYQYLYEDGPAVLEVPPPDAFTVQSGGDRISISWSDNASSVSGFDGYAIYRSEGNVMDPRTIYTKIFECGASDAVHQFDDRTAARGFDYYYYVQTKVRDASQGGKILYSSPFWTLTGLPANLLRPAGTKLNQVRVVPNPYDIRSRIFQFGEHFQYDRIAFYDIPAVCKLRIFTERGDLIWEKYHDDRSGDELWDSKTSSGQIIVSGIYILLVEVTEDIYDETTGDILFFKGETVYRKFVVIR